MGNTVVLAISWVAFGLSVLAVLAAFLAKRKRFRLSGRKKAEENYMGEGLCIGLCLGVGVGFLTHTFGLWLGAGMLFGLATGMSLVKKS